MAAGAVSHPFVAMNGYTGAMTQDLAGQKFGRWTVKWLEKVESGGRMIVAARVRCSCGNVKTVRLDKLRAGRSQSCGCLRRETAAETGRANAGKVRKRRRHVLGPHYLSATWQNILLRCENEANPDFPAYGGRGIRLHGPWHDFAVFVEELEAEIGPRPDAFYASGWPRHTLDRLDNDKGYEPGNLRWATASEQVKNQRRTVEQHAD